MRDDDQAAARARRDAYRAANPRPLRPATPWKINVVRGLAVLIVLAMIANVVALVWYLASG